MSSYDNALQKNACVALISIVHGGEQSWKVASNEGAVSTPLPLLWTLPNCACLCKVTTEIDLESDLKARCIELAHVLPLLPEAFEMHHAQRSTSG